MRVLVVHGEWKIANALRDGLRAEQYDVTVEGTGEGAFFRATTEFFDVIILDLALPGRGGLEILTALRAGGNKVPILVLTAPNSTSDRVASLDAGADDYLVAPCAVADLVTRIRSLPRWDARVSGEGSPFPLC